MTEQFLEEIAFPTISGRSLKPPDEVVRALLAAEKKAKKTKVGYSFAELIGTWRLFFVTGTTKTRKRAGVILGAGKYLPQFFKITLTYQAIENGRADLGRVENCVDLRLLKLSLTGPAKFLTPQNILAFDFTRMHIKLFGATLYDGYIRAGKDKEAGFDTESIKKQAFFTYFYLHKSVIAARGRGGGLALWTRL